MKKWQVFINIFVNISRKVDTFISILHKMFLLSYYLMVWWWLKMKGPLFANVSKKRNVNVRFNIAYFVHIWNIWNISCHKKSLTFNLFFISKFKFDRVYGKILKYIQVSLLKPSFVKHWFIWYLLKHGTTWNKLQRSETTCNEQETTWNTLQRARNNLKQPTTSKYNLQRMGQSVLFSNIKHLYIIMCIYYGI